MAGSPATDFDAVVHRMFHRDGLDTLPQHLEEHHGIGVAKLTTLDVGVFRVDRQDKGPSVVARLFAAGRRQAAVDADLAVLRYLADQDFPAERPYGDQPLSRHHNQPVLVTEFVRSVAKAKRPPYPIIRLGAMVGRLHEMTVPAGAERPAGALHHFAEGTMGDELRAVAGWIDSIEARVPESVDAIDDLREAVLTADGGDGLPQALIHPDPVPKNAIFTAEGPVLVDWTGAGRGSRLASMSLILRSGWAAKPFLRGYAHRICLTDEERERLAALLFSRRLIDQVFKVCRDPATAVATASRLPALRRHCETTALDLLAA